MIVNNRILKKFVLRQRTNRSCAAARVGLLALTTAGLAWFAVPAFAADSGPTQAGEICMQKVFGTPVSAANRLNCTAKDIRLSRVISVSPDTCIRGTTFDVQATFEVAVTANNRYDPGFFFRTDGGANARGDGVNATGTCSLSALTPPPPANAPVLDLDGDTCGDLNAGTVNVSFTIPGVSCADSDGDRKLNLPYCTSWHSNQGTACDIDEPFDFNPDTKSKCVCDDDFELPVEVEDAELSVDKSASPEQISEPGGQVTFTVKATNIAEVESVVIGTLDDDVFGDLADANNQAVTDNTCPDLLVGETLAPGEMLSCTFKAQILGNAGFSHTNTVEVCAAQPPSTVADVCGEDDATVTVINLLGGPDPTLDKTAQATRNCRMDVDYQVVVNNNSTVDVLTVVDLDDDGFGDFTQVAGDVLATDCTVPQDIQPLENYSCTFTARIEAADCAIDHTNTVTADTIDDDDFDFQPFDDATVILSTKIP